MSTASLDLLTRIAEVLESAGQSLGQRKLATVEGVDLNTGDPTSLYTAPAGKEVIVTEVVMRDASASLTTASISFGWNSADFNDVIANATHTALNAATKYKRISAAAGAVKGAEADVFSVKANTPQGGAATCTIDVFGYLVDA